MKKKLRTLRCVIVIKDTSRKEVKEISVLQRQLEICQKLKINMLVTNFAPHHAKYLYAPAGKRWTQWYNTYCVGKLGADADDIEKVAIYMNKTFSVPRTGSKGRCRRRYTFVTEPIPIHTKSQYKSLPGSTKNHAYYILFGVNHIYYRRYVCVSCSQCANVCFLKCTNKYFGKCTPAVFVRKDLKK